MGIVLVIQARVRLASTTRLSLLSSPPSLHLKPKIDNVRRQNILLPDLALVLLRAPSTRTPEPAHAHPSLSPQRASRSARSAFYLAEWIAGESFEREGEEGVG